MAHRLQKVSFIDVKCPACHAQPVGNQNGWRDARKCTCPERKALARKVAAILVAHFVIRDRPCTGEAHSPAVGGMIDHCGVCMPNWGRVEYLAVRCFAEYKGHTCHHTPDAHPEYHEDLNGWCWD